jgi:hypothetical protein
MNSSAVTPLRREGALMARKKQPPVDTQTARTIGALLRGLRKKAGYRSVGEAARTPGCPAAQQTIYAYERGGLVPSLRQFMELVEFYALETKGAPESIRPLAVTALVQALGSPAYHVPEAYDLIARLLPPTPPPRLRRPRAG